MSKSNSEEIIALLWFILAALTTGWVAATAIWLGVFSVIASIYYGAVEVMKEKDVE